MKKVFKVLLLGALIDAFYGHLFAIWRNVHPKSFKKFFDTKDKYYEEIGIDNLWKKNKTED